MEFINRLAIVIVAFLLIQQNAAAAAFWAMNNTRQPIIIRVSYVGEVHWGALGCSLCPDEWLLAALGKAPAQNLGYRLKMQDAHYFINTGAKLVKRVDIYDAKDHFIIGKDMGNNMGIHGVLFENVNNKPQLTFTNRADTDKKNYGFVG